MTLREGFRMLSRPPETWWPDGAVHHGARALVLLVLAIAVTVFFPVAPLADFPVLERGMVAEEDIIAEVPFPIYKSDAELSRARQDAAASVPPVFVYDSTAVDSMLASVNRFFTRVDSVVEAGESQVAVRRGIRDLMGAYGLRPSEDDVELLRDQAQRTQLRRTVSNIVLDELPQGVGLAGELEEAGSQQIRLVGIGRERIVSPDSIPRAVDFFDRSRFHVPSFAPSGYEQLQRLLLVRFIVPSIRPDWTATQQARERQRAAVPVVKSEVLRGERIVTARERVGDEELEKVRAYQQELERLGRAGTMGGRGARGAGAFLFNLVILSLMGVLLYFYRPKVYLDFRHVTLIAFLILSVVGGAAIIAAYDASTMLIPIAFAALVIATLWDGRLALNLSLIVAVLLTGQAPFLGITALFTLVTAGAVASLTVRVVRRRAQIWGFIALIAGAYALTSIVLGLLRSWELGEVVWSTGWGALNAVASAFAAMGFLPLFEGYTRITTDQTLLELADANRPLLRRLSMEAPGTYAHSINVANLAEAAAGAIGANALLTRVGVYYHDVGKIARPNYFIENQPGRRNPHDKLKPAMSATVVRNHVVEGLKLAEEAKLPECVKDFIVEHHGTQSISFFYDQAREAEPDAELDPSDFEYPGPRPRSKETAIVMLADSVESAARVLPDPSPDNIRALVERIVRGKIDAGQLDDAPLTFRELTAIKEQFASVLSGMYHQRIDYPPNNRDGHGRSGGGAERGTAGEPAGEAGEAARAGA